MESIDMDDFYVIYDSDCFCGDNRCGSMIRIRKLFSTDGYTVEMKLRNGQVTSIILPNEEIIKMAESILQHKKSGE